MIFLRHGPLVSEIDLCAWLSQAAPNDALEYHRGFLVLDIDPRMSPLANSDRLELTQVASRARWAANKQLAHLVQRRLGEEVVGRARRAAAREIGRRRDDGDLHRPHHPDGHHVGRRPVLPGQQQRGSEHPRPRL